MTSASVGADAAVDAVADTGKSVITMAKSPVDTAKGLTGGVSRFFKRTTKTVGDVSDSILHDSDDSDDSNVSDLSSKAASSLIGIGKAHRELAQQLDVDPYSDNVVMQAELHRVANIAGSVRKITNIIIPIPSVISTAANVSDMVWSLSPADLLIQNQETLKTLEYDDDLAEAFFSNRMYSPTMQTAIVVALASFKDTKGTAAWLNMAVFAQTRVEARFVVRSIVLNQHYHEKVAPISDFLSFPHSPVPAALTSEGNGLVVFAMDQLSWTEEIDKNLEEFDNLFTYHVPDGKMLFWAEGKTSDMASTQLQSRGFEEFTMPLDLLDSETD